ncbi:MAG: hypothetical protein R3F15_02965 [Lysobacterales bacterium]
MKSWTCALLGILLGGTAVADDTTADADKGFVVPDGFELRMLEPLGGRVARPNGWFYREAHDAASFKWVLSAENPEDGPYQTGVRIQLIAAVQAKTGQSAKAFVEEFLEGRRASAKVIDECPVEDQGLLTRTCIRTEESIPSANSEEPFQIQYSVFWGNQLDVALFVTSGTLASRWTEYQPLFEEIEKFELIDLDRFDGNGQPLTDEPAKDEGEAIDEDAAVEPNDGSE